VSDIVSEEDLEGLFGEMYTGDQRVWAVCFGVEHTGVYARDDDATALLKEDFNQVPVVTGLDETARFILPIFYTSGAIRNINIRPGLINI
jgi:hypothetical protein